MKRSNFFLTSSKKEGKVIKGNDYKTSGEQGVYGTVII